MNVKKMFVVVLLFFSLDVVFGETDPIEVFKKVVCIPLDESGKIIKEERLVLEELQEGWFIEHWKDLYVNGLLNKDYRVDYGSSLELNENKLYVEDEILAVEVVILDEDLTSFNNPLNMEPFFVEYRYENKFFERSVDFRAKCQHLSVF